MLSLGGATLNVSFADVSVVGTLGAGAGQIVGARAVAVAGGGTLRVLKSRGAAAY